MTRIGKRVHWVGMVVGLPTALYSGTSFMYYLWLNAAEPQRWPSAKATVWILGWLGAALFFLGVFVYCVVSLIREYNRRYREERDTTT